MGTEPYIRTPNAERYMTAIRKSDWLWEIIQFYNCRKIAGSSSWSQHSESNGLDIFVTKEKGDALVDWTLDTVETSAGPMTRWDAYGVRTMLWWGKSVRTGNAVSDHFDHIHIDFWPKMQNISSYVPPCKGGSLLVVHKDGTTAKSWSLWPAHEIYEEEKLVAIKEGATGFTVILIQQSLNRWNTKGATDPFPLVEDGVFGAKTTTAVELFQNWTMEAEKLGLPSGYGITGDVDEFTFASLLRWAPPKHGPHSESGPGMGLTVTKTKASHIGSKSTLVEKDVVTGVTLTEL